MRGLVLGDQDPCHCRSPVVGGRGSPGCVEGEAGARRRGGCRARRGRRAPRPPLGRWPGPARRRRDAPAVAAPGEPIEDARSDRRRRCPGPVSLHPEAAPRRRRRREPIVIVASRPLCSTALPGQVHDRLREPLARRPPPCPSRVGGEPPVAVARTPGLWRTAHAVNGSTSSGSVRRKSGRSSLASSNRSSTIRLMRSSSSVTRAIVSRALVGVVAEKLEVAADDRDRRAELVPGVVDERALGRERRLEPVEHGVERAGQVGDLVPAVDLDPAGQVGLADGPAVSVTWRIGRRIRAAAIQPTRAASSTMAAATASAVLMASAISSRSAARKLATAKTRALPAASAAADASSGRGPARSPAPAAGSREAGRAVTRPRLVLQRTGAGRRVEVPGDEREEGVALLRGRFGAGRCRRWPRRRCRTGGRSPGRCRPRAGSSPRSPERARR